jgi:hypothetical protein
VQWAGLGAAGRAPSYEDKHHCQLPYQTASYNRSSFFLSHRVHSKNSSVPVDSTGQNIGGVSVHCKQNEQRQIGFALGSFGFVLALGAPDERKIVFALGSFGFVLGSFWGGRKGKCFHKSLSNKGF